MSVTLHRLNVSVRILVRFSFRLHTHTCIRSIHFVFIRCIPCSILILSTFYLFTNWYTSLKNTILKFTLKFYIKTAPTRFGVTVTPSSGNALILILFFKTTHWCISWWISKTLTISISLFDLSLRWRHCASCDGQSTHDTLAQLLPVC